MTTATRPLSGSALCCGMDAMNIEPSSAMSFITREPHSLRSGEEPRAARYDLTRREDAPRRTHEPAAPSRRSAAPWPADGQWARAPGRDECADREDAPGPSASRCPDIPGVGLKASRR